ncbi:MAG: hypothetical protein NTY19_03325 [Planctomycetota bacterium]|nr:hypothetical protein [Planctomycetota bacterium]
MPQRDPDRAVADATGETTSAVRRRGLVVIAPRRDSIDPEPDDVPPQYLDWERMLETRPVHPGPRRVEGDPCVAPF